LTEGVFIQNNTITDKNGINFWQVISINFFGKSLDFKKLKFYIFIPTHKYTGQGAKLLAGP